MGAGCPWEVARVPRDLGSNHREASSEGFNSDATQRTRERMFAVKHKAPHLRHRDNILTFAALPFSKKAKVTPRSSQRYSCRVL